MPNREIWRAHRMLQQTHRTANLKRFALPKCSASGQAQLLSDVQSKSSADEKCGLNSIVSQGGKT